ncbi:MULTISPECIES: hypothetical protein [unclassified Clostridium]|uniref:hypothetical protein n=1 Tax=unclassified Clostridium TaxID=2614128 RepID=UPI00029749E9|nr:MULTISPECIES: hypothetical protein [unclassified Clostridium]EKQ52743.1 MAG: hypothetical protein A370_04048 [Clostridium sp. Maddingley MBC34-26]
MSTTIASRIDFKKPRQKEWGIIQNGNLATLNYGNETDSKGNSIMAYSSNCYDDVLEQAKILINSGIGTMNVQVVEFVPYDYIMQPRV